MPNNLSKDDFVVVKEPTLTGKKISYTCPSCQTEGPRKRIRTIDNAGAWYASARCRCGTLALFTDRYGSYLH